MSRLVISKTFGNIPSLSIFCEHRELIFSKIYLSFMTNFSVNKIIWLVDANDDAAHDDGDHGDDDDLLHVIGLLLLHVIGKVVSRCEALQ